MMHEFLNELEERCLATLDDRDGPLTCPEDDE